MLLAFIQKLLNQSKAKVKSALLVMRINDCLRLSASDSGRDSSPHPPAEGTTPLFIVLDVTLSRPRGFVNRVTRLLLFDRWD